MNSNNIENNVKAIVDNLNQETFIYELLLAYGISKTSIVRLKKGDFNLSKIEGEVLYKNKIFFKTSNADRLLIEVEDAATDARILKQNPRLIIVTDFNTIAAKDLKTKLNADFPIADLPKYKDFFYPISGGEIYKSSNDNKADRDAAYKLAQLYDNLVTENIDIYREGSHNLNVFLSRLLFCFFAEDTGIFEKESVFTETLSNNTAQNGADVHEFLNQLFHKLNTKDGDFPKYLEQFPYVNGGLFRDDIQSPKFSAKSRSILVECGDLDWSEINPDIFGSMIQAVADPDERSDLGMHYTSVPNIKKLIEPLFLDELYDSFQKFNDSSNNLKKLANRIAKIKFFDPACGSGNFLIITYKEIRLLEIKIIQRLIDLEKGKGINTLYFTSIRLSQFYGIEIKDFAHEMAILSLWLAEHQMNRVFENELEGYGQSKPILPLKEAGKIVCDNAVIAKWEDVCQRDLNDEVYILGNPPYLGARIQNASQKNDMDFVFGHLKKYRDLDYISCWFYKAKDFINGYLNSKVAFVSTNSICQGQQVSLLWPSVLSDGLEIDFAHLSFKWTNNAKSNAGVTVIIVGLRNKVANKKFLFINNFKRAVININAYLIDYSDVYVYESNVSISKFPKMNFGNMPNDGGGLIITEKERDELVNRNYNAEKFTKVLLGSYEFINRQKRYCLWIENEDLEVAKKDSFINNRILISKEHRLNSKDKGTNKLALRAHQFRDRNIPKESQLIIPRHSSESRDYIPIDFLDANTIIADSAMAVYDADSWLFGVLHSKMHMAWVRAIGGKIKTDYRYSAKLCYNTFPFPQINLRQKQIIDQYVYQILDERAKYPEKTMAWMYNSDTMPLGLKKAHEELDQAVERIYRLNPFQNDVERLEYLFKLYEEMTKKHTLFAKQKKTRTKKTMQSE